MEHDQHALLDRPEYVGTTLSYGDVDEVLLVCHSHAIPDHFDWQMLLERLAITDYRVLLVSTCGGSPLPEQRVSLVRTLRDGARQPPRIAVLSTSSRMRWINAALRITSELDVLTLAFADVSEAMLFLEGVPNAERVDVARKRAHYLIEKQVAAHQAHFQGFA
jgi:hypothetical protein